MMLFYISVEKNRVSSTAFYISRMACISSMGITAGKKNMFSHPRFMASSHGFIGTVYGMT